MLSAYGHREAAIRLGRARLPHGDADPIQRYLFDAVVGEKLDRAPRDYLIAYFDRFAETFDRQLVDVLGYDVPEKLARLVAAHGRELPRAVDLGCGTGLAAQHFGRDDRGSSASTCRHACSPKRRSGAPTTNSSKPTWSPFSSRPSETFDLVFVADALIYLGGLDAFLAAAARVMPAGALLAFNVETTDFGAICAASFRPLRPRAVGAARRGGDVVHALRRAADGVALGGLDAGRGRVDPVGTARRLT